MAASHPGRPLPLLLLSFIAVLLASCTTTVPGSASAAPPPPKPPLSDPCDLLTAEQAKGVGLKPEPKFTEGDPARIVPPSCRWEAVEDLGETDSLDVTLSVEFSFAEYADSVPVIEEREISGLRWIRFTDPIGGDSACNFAVELGETSFVQVGSSDYGGTQNPCVTPEAAIPQIASHLPGGLEAPPPVNPDAVPPSALSTVDPCALLSPEELDGLGFQANPDPGSLGETPKEKTVSCEWDNKLPDNSSMYVFLAPGKTAEEAAYGNPKVEQFDTGGKSWNVHKSAAPELASACDLRLPFTQKSSVGITSGDRVDPAKACDAGKRAAELITPKLPTS